MIVAKQLIIIFHFLVSLDFHESQSISTLHDIQVDRRAASSSMFKNSFHHVITSKSCVKNGDIDMERACDECFMTMRDVALLLLFKTNNSFEVPLITISMTK